MVWLDQVTPWMVQYGQETNCGKGGTNYGTMDGPAGPTKAP